MTALVTGGAGFIGSHLCEALVAAGETVSAVDDLSTGREENLEALLGHERFSLTIGSVTDARLMQELVGRADRIYHLAAAVGVELIVRSPVRTIETNIRGTETVLEAASRSGCPLLLASTSEVYGKAERVPFAETDDLLIGPPQKGRWAYACSKAIDEFLALAYWRERGLPVTVLRLFNVIGPRQTGRYGMVVPRLVRQALAEETMTVYGDGSQRRCFVDVDEIVAAMTALMAEAASFGEVFNVGGVEEISMLELAHLVRERVGSRSDIRLVPYDEAYEPGFEDMARRVPDLRKVRGVIDFSPRRDLASILDRVIVYWRERLALPSGRSS